MQSVLSVSFDLLQVNVIHREHKWHGAVNEQEAVELHAERWAVQLLPRMQPDVPHALVCMLQNIM